GDFARRVEGLDNVSGLVGYELFKRFPVMIDYQRSRAIFYDPQKFKYAGNGTPVPFRFKGHVPEVDGTIDGIAGAFDIDTGSRSSSRSTRRITSRTLPTARACGSSKTNAGSRSSTSSLAVRRIAQA